MLVDLDSAAITALMDLARDEIKSIERGDSHYGNRDDNVDMISTLDEAVSALAHAIEGRGW